MKARLLRLAEEAGARGLGVAPADRMGNLPSMDPEYLLPGTRSVLSILVPYDGEKVRRYLAKEDHAGFQEHETEVYRSLYRIGKALETLLRAEGHRALVCEPNLDYRFKDSSRYRRVPYPVRQRFVDFVRSPGPSSLLPLKRLLVRLFFLRDTASVDWNLTPSFSHRYGAVAAGLGSFGWSGNVMTPAFGSRVLFNTVLTTAALEPDPMLDETPCDGCRVCVRVCQAGMIHPKEEDRVLLGGRTFIHGRKGHNLRCILCCAGFTGQSRYPGWSTWSPGRIRLPETDRGMVEFWNRQALENLWKPQYYAKVLADLVFHNEYGFIRKPCDRFLTTCGNCQLVCWENRKDRERNHEILVTSGEVVEGPGFSLRVVKGRTGVP